jgi:hypothetical protein
LAIPIYTARCLSALLRLYEWDPDERYLLSAHRMGEFLRCMVVEGGTLFGVYPDGRAIVCPTWISASGDVLRALLALLSYTEVNQAAVLRLTEVLVDGQSATGGIPTANGLAKKGRTKMAGGLPDFRDVLPVVGWCDKAFRALALVAEDIPAESVKVENATMRCEWKGRNCEYQEDQENIKLIDVRRNTTIYHWHKGDVFPCRFHL